MRFSFPSLLRVFRIANSVVQETSSALRNSNESHSGVPNAFDHQPYWERCEQRLALSSLPWMPWDVGPTEVSSGDEINSMHPSIASIGPQQPDNATLPPIDQHLSLAHAQTGWNQVHSQLGITGKGQTVAVIDSGIAFDHVALGKGFGAAHRVVGGWDFAENDARPYDDAPAGFHGTHVAGIIGANDGVHFGVAPNVDLVALRVFNDTGKGEIAWAENALRWVHENRNQFENPITTVNLSLGAAWNSSNIPSWATLEEELSQLQRDGIVVVVSAGNAFQQNPTPGLSYPAASPFVIPVSSIDSTGALSEFSQRDARTIAAPGRAIESTVPDYFFGKDGIHNDWAKANGTSMAAPYISGATVLVREAMEMVGAQDITPQSIYEHLKSTSNSVWDSITQRNYMSLDLDRAIESILPRDTTGDTWGTAQIATIQSAWHSENWINTIGDEDVYRLQPSQSGTLSAQIVSEYLDDVVVNLLRNGQESSLASQNGRVSFSVVAGEAVGLSVADLDSIGPYRLNWTFTASSSNGDNAIPSIPQSVVDLGSVDVLEQNLSGTSRYQTTAEHTGLMSVIVNASSQTNGILQILRPGHASGSLSDSTIENGQWRIDVQVNEGQMIEFALPSSQQYNVKIVNLVGQQGDHWTLHGTEGPDRFELDLSNGLSAKVAGVHYDLSASGTGSVMAHGNLNNDSLTLLGSNGAEKVELRPGNATLSHDRWSIAANEFETVQFVGNGGPDRAYLYDAATDDRLNSWPNKAELTGVGYAFQVEQADRIFVHALQGGDDQAFIFDSAGDDNLSVRPQFTSLSGQSYFNYVSGFERVFAYASAGGVDRASLYDSSGDDLLSSSGELTSIVGPGFSTFARNFEKVEAYASAGGIDRATIFAPVGGSLISGTGFVGMQDAQRSSVARNFERVESYPSLESITPQSHSLSTTSPMYLAETGSVPAIGSASFGNPVMETESIFLSPVNKHWVSLDLAEHQDHASGEPIASADAPYAALETLDLSWLDEIAERQLMDAAFSELS